MAQNRKEVRATQLHSDRWTLLRGTGKPAVNARLNLRDSVLTDRRTFPTCGRCAATPGTAENVLNSARSLTDLPAAVGNLNLRRSLKWLQLSAADTQFLTGKLPSLM